MVLSLPADEPCQADTAALRIASFAEMTKPAAHRPRTAFASARSTRAWLAFVASCAVLLQLCSALHFSLVSHRFNADLGSFVHEHVLQQQKRAVAAPEAPPEQPSFVRGTAACAPDVCPVGFAGTATVLLAAASLSQLLELPPVTVAFHSRHAGVNRARCLLSAPKTSPPQLG
jgi:hypothetical protein